MQDPVDAIHPHGNALAQTVGRSTGRAGQPQTTLVEQEPLVPQQFHADQPLDEVLHELDEHPETRHAGDHAFELLAHTVLDEREFLPLEQLPLRGLGVAFEVRADLAQCLKRQRIVCRGIRFAVALGS